MPSRPQSPLTQKFHKRCATLNARKKIAHSQLKFPHTMNVYGLANILTGCFNQLASPSSLPNEAITKNGITYFLTSKGHGLQTHREAEGGVRGDAYRDYLTLLLPNKVMISCDITEDSYQPEINFTLMGGDQEEVDKAGKVLSEEMRRRAG
ncbi:MAG: hypothetical protein HZC38_15695 [Chloroflexi bacterium]|nr:hypothetical protein [Chloroflexota bacterium]